MLSIYNIRYYYRKRKAEGKQEQERKLITNYMNSHKARVHDESFVAELR